MLVSHFAVSSTIVCWHIYTTHCVNITNIANALLVLQSPTVACLYSAYISNISASVGLATKFLTSSAAVLNAC